MKFKPEDVPDRSYTFECGCSLTTSRKTDQRCPEHKAGILRVEIDCIDCGKTIEINSSAGNQKRCKPCQKVHYTQLQREYWKVRGNDLRRARDKRAKRKRVSKGRCRICGAILSSSNPTGKCRCHSNPADMDIGREAFLHAPWRYCNRLNVIAPDGLPVEELCLPEIATDGAVMG